jgi:putative transposase
VYSLIAVEKTNFPVAVMCRVLGVSRTAFHNWERRAPSDRALSDAWLTEKIRQIHDASRGVYGAPRIHAELRLEHGIHVGRKRVAVDGGRRYLGRQTPEAVEDDDPDPGDHTRHRSGRAALPARPAERAVGRGHHLPAHRRGLALPRRGAGRLLRQIVGWSMATHMRASLVVDALNMALARRRPGPRLIHHSDRGSRRFNAVHYGPQRCTGRI